ncbi:hypothetical protein TNCV_151061 [Trichonephila clavipes]|uniref:Transposase n=1 Tax=Trichonephila clavipes TaxID=2585209 RepID=A0A8X6V4X7_TRICX|nr:hypothetical protein TNCV_151061 [Trichonephila clavipes]
MWEKSQGKLEKAGLSPTDIKTELDATLGEFAPLFTTVKTWVADFKHGHTSIQDAEHSRRPKSDTTDEIFRKVPKKNYE